MVKTADGALSWIQSAWAAVGKAASRWIGRDDPPLGEARVFLNVYEKESGDMVVANIEIVAEESDDAGRYRFYRANGTSFDLNLTDGDFRMVRRWQYSPG